MDHYEGWGTYDGHLLPALKTMYSLLSTYIIFKIMSHSIRFAYSKEYSQDTYKWAQQHHIVSIEMAKTLKSVVLFLYIYFILLWIM